MRRSLAIAAVSFLALGRAGARQHDSTSIAERVVTRADARQPRTDAERRIWKLMMQEDDVRAPVTEDPVFVSGAYPVKQRRNESSHVYPSG